VDRRARLPGDFIVDVRRRTDLVSLIGEEIALKRSGKRYMACCPFHDDRSPSFEVDPVRGTYMCRGCDAKGDAFTWVQEREHLTFWEALVKLSDRVGLSIPRSEPRTAEEVQALRSAGATASALRQAASLYAYGLDSNDQARNYLAKRGIRPETAQTFGLGYVRSGIHKVLTNRVVDPESIIRAGIVTRHDGGRETELLRNRLTIALRNERGHVVGFAGRHLYDQVGSPKYINTPETELFRKSRELFGLDLARRVIAEMRSVILMEGYFDVISMHQAGECRAVAGMGTALSDAQADRLLRDVTTVYLCLDGDKAGKRATIAAAKLLLSRMKDGQEIRIVRLPGGLDPDDYLREHGADAWRAQLGASLPLSDFVLEVVCGDVDADAPELLVQQALRSREWLPLCERCPLYGQALRHRLQRRLGIEL
jgi:DNA primase